VLVGEIPSTPSHADELWGLLAKVQGITIPEGEQGLRNPEDAVCAIVAVLFEKHRNWLRAHPDRESRCRDALQHVLNHAPPVPRFSEYSAGLLSWDTFCARLVPALWAETPAAPELRKAIAYLALSMRYSVVATLMVSAAQFRASLGRHFQQLEGLLLKIAVARHKARLQQYDRNPAFDPRQWAEQHISLFVESKLESPPDDWSELPEPHSQKLAWGQHGDRPTGDMGICLDQLLAAYAWTENLEVALNDDERHRIIRIHSEMLKCFLRTLNVRSPEPDTHRDEFRFPCEDERRLLERVANVMVQMRAGEDDRQFWFPILELGSRGHHFVEAFLDQFFNAGLGNAAGQETFTREWNVMLEYASASSQWQEDVHRSRFHLEDMWHHLLG